MIFVVVAFLAIALILNSSYRFDLASAAPKVTRGPIECGHSYFISDFIQCCQDETDSKGLTIRWCTECRNTSPPSDCSPRHPEGTSIGNPPVPLKSRPPVVGTEPPSVAPPSTPGAIEQPPSTVKDNSSRTSSTSQHAFSPTGGCVPGGSACIPCDIGLARIGANCIPSGDWHPGVLGPGTELGGGTSTPPTVQPPPSQGGAIEQPPTNVAPPKVCPDGSAPDTNGKCPPVTQAPTDQGTTTTQSPTNDNNNNPKHHKGSELSQLPSITGGDNNNNNNDKPSKQKHPKSES